MPDKAKLPAFRLRSATNLTVWPNWRAIQRAGLYRRGRVLIERFSNNPSGCVTACFAAILGRAPTELEHQEWLQGIDQADRFGVLLSNLVMGEEFKKRMLTEMSGPLEELVEVGYHAALRRKADAGGKAHFMAKLTAGETAGSFLRDLCESDEFKNLLVVQAGDAMRSYAQNFEDVMLRRALSDIDQGFYVDIGAWHPKTDSVTKHFYDKGWTGVNVEPSEYYYNLLQRERPRDINVEAIVAGRRGKRDLHIMGDSGLSTLLPLAAHAAELNGHVKTQVVEVDAITLESLIRTYCPDTVIDFLKVDAEGAEAEILLNCKFDDIRPRIILVEATEPMTQNPAWDDWEPHLLARGYLFAWFDGLNRFYVRAEDGDRLKFFKTPPNLWDNFRRV